MRPGQNSLVRHVVYQITGILSLRLLGVEGEPVRAEVPGGLAPGAHPVLVALLRVGEHPGLLGAREVTALHEAPQAPQGP